MKLDHGEGSEPLKSCELIDWKQTGMEIGKWKLPVHQS